MVSYLQIENLSKSYGTFVMFEDISFQLAKDQKIALIARNGTGKTTLFNILCGKDVPDSGKVTFHKDISIGFLEQDPPYVAENTVLEHVLSSTGKLSQVIENYEHALLLHDQDRLQKAIEEMDHIQAWDFETRMKQILGKLKIFDYDKKMGELSGGQRKRVALAKTLVSSPDLLILDEPTNHLDLEMIEWLEEYLKVGNFTLLMVTHDRYFLDRVCREIIEIDNRKLFLYKGNYSYYLEKRSDRIDNENTNIDKARNLYSTELDWIRRMPQARGTKAKYRVDAFEEIKEKAFSAKTEKQVNINVKTTRLGSKIIDASYVNKAYGDNILITDFTYKFARFEKAGIIGNNGTGKSTLLNILTGAIKPDSGKIDLGETVKIGYYKQDGMQFDEQMKVLDVAQQVAEVVTLGDGNRMGVAQFLNYFLFPPEVQHSFVYKLSGGEKRRLYLMTVLMQNPNFLILDEPTNDLDLLTLNVLEDYLKNFSGCVLIVSHDRYFMDKLVNHVFVFEGNGVISDFPGNYSDYRYAKDLLEKETRAIERKEEKKPIAANIKSSPLRKLTYKEQLELESIVNEIDLLEKEKKTVENQLSSGKLKPDELVEKSNRIGSIMTLIDTKTERWMELSEKAV